ncbi:hypothetical protein JYK14_27820 [Siccirubricoccus sp. KC 17139]|uniref:MotA/TolQ/ExbB proton channel domain-containing protein n=1 Tax=Siccirubricoccus soli TaxID=2899147 RepID=A0ABT1DDD0_9PROT|nr:hypothetical protein [Siccirubricoccus soli]MCO6419941.1 hypothetical protein [Siccirubricoccus soli]MCP2686076.1 hypothetical protein [Siccirubricoccus soli]
MSTTTFDKAALPAEEGAAGRMAPAKPGGEGKGWDRIRRLWRGAEATPRPERRPLNPLEYVRELQADLAVLTRHTARRSDRGFLAEGEATSATMPAAPCLPPCNAQLAELLLEKPEELVTDAGRVARLVQQIDLLSSQVRPANVSTIRLTCAYVGTNECGDLPDEIHQEARRLKRWMGVIALIGTVALFFAVCLLVHTGNGRNMLKELAAQKAAQGVAWGQVEAAQRSGPGGSQPGAGVSDPCSSGAALPPGPLASACATWLETDQKLKVTHERLRQWNESTQRLGRWWIFRWVAPRKPSNPPQGWPVSDVRVGAGLYALSGFVLPMLLGLVGACAYVYQRINQKIEEWTLEARDKWQSGLRVLLGLTLGGLVGALFTSGESVQMQGGVTLSLAAIAFFVGYAVQVVFTLFDAIIRPVADRLKGLFGASRGTV